MQLEGNIKQHFSSYLSYPRPSLNVHHKECISFKEEKCPQNCDCVHVFDRYSAFLDQNTHRYKMLFTQYSWPVEWIPLWLCVCVCMHRHVAYSCRVVCNYLLMCHSIRQSRDPWWLLDSLETSLRRSHTAFKLNFQLASVTQRIMARHTHSHTHMHTKTQQFWK